MNSFLLSPGITPLLTDLFVLEFPVALGLAYAVRRGSGVELVVALNVVALGLVKLVTDYGDTKDLFVALAGVAGGLVVLSRWLPGPAVGRALRFIERLVGVLIIPIGLYKAVGDFYDPFDLLLADLIMVAGVWIIFGVQAKTRAPPLPNPPAVGDPSREGRGS